MSEIRTSAEALVGQRVREAREALGLSQDALAQRIKLPRTAISAIENGKRQVTTTELLAIGEALQRPFKYFLRAQDIDPLPFLPLLRVEPLPEQTAEARHAIQQVRETLVRFEEICHSYAELEELNGLPMPALPRPALSPGRYVARDAEQLAEWVRMQLGLGPTVPPLQLRNELEERYGVKTFVLRSASKLSGASIYHERIGGCVLLSARPAAHMLFTLAHELAHLLIHRDVPSLDEELFVKTPREQFANAFAASLLMPRAGVQEMFASLYRSRQDLSPVDIAHMARHFGASYSAMLWRLQGLRLISPPLREALLRSRQRPAGAGADPAPAEQVWQPLPERYLFLAARAYQQELVSIGWLAEVLYDADGHRQTVEEAYQLIDSYQGAATDWDLPAASEASVGDLDEETGGST